MIRLKNLSDKTYEFRLTNCPINNPQASPMPTGKRLEDLDEKSPRYIQQRDEILKHPNYSSSRTIVLEPGINEFKNEEHAEYLYKILGNPDVGGTIPFGIGEKRAIVNKNWLIEVDKDENEVKDNLFLKYRQNVATQTYDLK